MLLKPLSRCAAMALFLALLPYGARADLLPVFDSIAYSGGSYLYTYHVNLTANSLVDNKPAHQDFVTLIDFGGYVAGTATVLTSVSGNTADWIIYTPATGPPAFNQNPVDSAAERNIDFNYQGAVQILGPQNTPPVFTFSLRSYYNATSTPNGVYDGETTAISPVGAVQGNSGQYRGPSVPEPGIMTWMSCISLLGCVFIYRRREKTRSTTK